MPRKPVTVTFSNPGARKMTKVAEKITHPSGFKQSWVKMGKPTPLSPIAAYAKRKKITTYEALKKFQDEKGKCEHTFKVIANAGHYGSNISLHACTECGKMKRYGRR